MTIETKYNIWDKVWVANIFREPIEVKIYGIVAEVKDSNVLINYHVGLDEDGCVLKKRRTYFPHQRGIAKKFVVCCAKEIEFGLGVIRNRIE